MFLLLSKIIVKDIGQATQGALLKPCGSAIGGAELGLLLPGYCNSIVGFEPFGELLIFERLLCKGEAKFPPSIRQFL